MLVLLIGHPGVGKSALLRALGASRGAAPLHVGSLLGRRLALIPHGQRNLQAGALLSELSGQHAESALLLLDNLELLFDRTMQLDPLALLKAHSRSRRVVAVWPGLLRDGRLVYAEKGHPEHRDYAVDGVVPFVIP